MFIPNPTARLGEKIAKDYLLENGYKIIELNFRKGYGEIDIIAVDKDILVFVEVKTRRSNKFGSPIEAITPSKLKTLERTALYYKKLHPQLSDKLRIDAVSVIIGEGQPKVELIKNIYD